MAGSAPGRSVAKRFVVLGGPGGRLAAVPVGADCLSCEGVSYGYLSRWQRLFTVNRPMNERLAQAATEAALRRFELVNDGR